SSVVVVMASAAPEMFTLKMLQCTWNGLKDPHSILLSASSAKALFGNQDPLGKIVKINTEVNVQVTGVYEDLPRNTELHEIKFFAPFALWASMNDWIAERALNDWANHFLYVYVQIEPTSS